MRHCFHPFLEEHNMLKKRIYTLCFMLLLLMAYFVFTATQQSRAPHRDLQVLMDMYYRLKQSNPNAAEKALSIVLQQDENYLPALREGSQWYLHEKNLARARPLLERLHALLPENSRYAAQLARVILLSLEKGTHRPCRVQAQWALNAMASYLPVYTDASHVVLKDHKVGSVARTHLTIMKTKQSAASVMPTHLGGLQIKALPAPYFSEIFFTPFTQSRFGLTVRPFIARAGVEQGNRFQTKQYVFLRRTDDNRSRNFGQISQIYEDDVQITGVGAQVKPFPSLPVVGFVEAGTAYDLVYRDRDRWRGDLRAGFMYYQNIGCQPAYDDVLNISLNYYGEWYADMIYFSRYQNNVIGGAVTRHRIRALQYKSSVVNVYVVGRALTDTQRVFYNNFAEIGPGIGFVPSNRFNLQLRFEHLQGIYLPAGAIPNPYPKHYTNNVVQLLFYVKL
ncbi:MAG TPA: hypothetical protein DDY37_07220 [Legionella sp.]|nr:hypothetical protein [Legionella sp.]